MTRVCKVMLIAAFVAGTSCFAVQSHAKDVTFKVTLKPTLAVRDGAKWRYFVARQGKPSEWLKSDARITVQEGEELSIDALPLPASPCRSPTQGGNVIKLKADPAHPEATVTYTGVSCHDR